MRVPPDVCLVKQRILVIRNYTGPTAQIWQGLVHQILEPFGTWLDTEGLQALKVNSFGDLRPEVVVPNIFEVQQELQAFNGKVARYTRGSWKRRLGAPLPIQTA